MISLGCARTSGKALLTSKRYFLFDTICEAGTVVLHCALVAVVVLLPRPCAQGGRNALQVPKGWKTESVERERLLRLESLEFRPRELFCDDRPLTPTGSPMRDLAFCTAQRVLGVIHGWRAGEIMGSDIKKERVDCDAMSIIIRIFWFVEDGSHSTLLPPSLAFYCTSV